MLLNLYYFCFSADGTCTGPMCSHSCVTAKPNDGKPTAVTDFAEMTLTGNRGAVTKVDKSR